MSSVYVAVEAVASHDQESSCIQMIEQGRDSSSSPVSEGRACVTAGGGKWVLQSHCHQENPGSSLAPLGPVNGSSHFASRKTSALPKTEGELSPGAGDRVR